MLMQREALSPAEELYPTWQVQNLVKSVSGVVHQILEKFSMDGNEACGETYVSDDDVVFEP